MSVNTATTALPLAPKDYDQDYMNRLIRQLNLAITKLTAVGPIVVGSDGTYQSGHPVSGITFINVPTSPTSLPGGSLWCDTSNSNVIKIVPES